MKNNAAILGRGFPAVVFLLAIFLAPPAANAALTEFFTATGKLFLSVDGAGSNNAAGHIAEVQKPSASATVRRAFVLAASTGFSGRVLSNGDVTINGTRINWDAQTPGAINNSNHWADVTSIVKPIIDVAAAGRIPFTLTEVNPIGIEGEVLVVVFDDPTQARDTTVILLFGGQAVDGDTFAITLAEPIDPNSAGARADMGLGISFGFQPSGQFSIVNIGVNGQRLSTSAGGQDDGVAADGALITVGGLDDSNANPPNPNANDQTCGPPAAPRCDDELYSLLPFIAADHTRIDVFTQNPSNDDNIFFAYFQISGAAIVGEGIVLGPASASNPVGTQHTVTAKVADENGDPVQGKLVTFEVTSGPNVGETGTDTTDANGEATFTYTGDGGAGTDEIEASFEDSQENTKTSNTVTKEWTGEGGDCVGPDPCVVINGVKDDVLYDDPPPPTGTPVPGVEVTFTANSPVEFTRRASVAPLGKCRVNPSRSVTRVDIVSNGAVLTARQANQLRQQLRRPRRNASFVAANGPSTFTRKVFSFDRRTLEAALRLGCDGARLRWEIILRALGPGAPPPVRANGVLDWEPE